MEKINSNLPNNGYDLCECNYFIINGVCSNPNCPIKQIYDNGYRVKPQIEKFPIIEID